MDDEEDEFEEELLPELDDVELAVAGVSVNSGVVGQQHSAAPSVVVVADDDEDDLLEDEMLSEEELP